MKKVCVCVCARERVAYIIRPTGEFMAEKRFELMPSQHRLCGSLGEATAV